MATARLQILLKATVDVDLEEYREIEDYTTTTGTGQLAEHYSHTLAGFFDNELNNCVEMPGHGVVHAVHTTVTILQEA